MSIFSVQLTTSRIGNLTRWIHTLLYVMTIHTYIHNLTTRVHQSELFLARHQPEGWEVIGDPYVIRCAQFQGRSLPLRRGRFLASFSMRHAPFSKLFFLYCMLDQVMVYCIIIVSCAIVPPRSWSRLGPWVCFRGLWRASACMRAQSLEIDENIKSCWFRRAIFG